MFEIAESRLDLEKLQNACADSQAGALVVFEGRVRDHNEGRQVNALEYEAYVSMACKEGKKILAEAATKFDILHLVCVHRVGLLQIGDLAVWIGVSSAHRDAAFEACRYVIDEVKSRVPIWKKEHYAQGDTEWVNCPQCARAAAARKVAQ